MHLYFKYLLFSLVFVKYVSCFIYETLVTYERLQSVGIYGNYGQYSDVLSPTQFLCEQYCLSNADCRAISITNSWCWVYNNTDVILQQPTTNDYLMTIVKYPLNQTVFHDIFLVNEYRYFRTFSMTTCYEKCLKDSKCYACTFKTGELNCLLYKRYKYGSYSIIDNVQTMFKPIMDNVEIRTGVRLKKAYKALHKYYERLCYEECVNDPNCQAATFVRVVYGIDNKQYSLYYQTLTIIDDCLLSGSFGDTVSDSKSVVYILK